MYTKLMPDAVLNRLLNLKVAKDRKGRAPNKPLLVLAILDLVEAGLVGMDGLVHKDAQLNLRYRSYSPICAPRRGNGIDLNLPFRHLASDGVYVHLGEGEQTVQLNPVLLAAMQGSAWRQEARKRVVAAYFLVLALMRASSWPIRILPCSISALDISFSMPARFFWAITSVVPSAFPITMLSKAYASVRFFSMPVPDV